jgi:hypothetical protein
MQQNARAKQPPKRLWFSYAVGSYQYGSLGEATANEVMVFPKGYGAVASCQRGFERGGLASIRGVGRSIRRIDYDFLMGYRANASPLQILEGVEDGEGFGFATLAVFAAGTDAGGTAIGAGATRHQLGGALQQVGVDFV